MSILVSLAVCLCGGLGASLRYVCDTWIKAYWKRAFPLSTFAINVTAGFAAGAVAALYASATVPDPWHLLLATGLLGGFSTFSTAINEMTTLARQRHWTTACGYLTAAIITPVAAVACGYCLF